MGKLHTHYPDMILLILTLVVLTCGMAFGVKLSGATQGREVMTFIAFALSYLSIALSFLIFTQVMQIKDNLNDLVQAQAPKVVPVAIKIAPKKK